MGEPLFITQLKLEEWIEDGEVLFEDNTLTIFAENASYRLEPAVRISKVLDGADGAGLVGKTLRVSELAELHAEHLRDSVIVADTAYECEEGFVASDNAKGEAKPEAPAPAQTAAEQKSSDMDMLTDFLLKHM